MKKIAWLAPVLIVTPLAFAGACGGEPADMDGSGGADGSGGNNPTGGAPNTGGSDGAGGSTGGSGGSTGGAPVTGGTAGMGGMGGMGGSGEDDPLLVACETLCATAVAGDASGCDEEDCVEGCAVGYVDYYMTAGCYEEYLAWKQCFAELDGGDFACDSGTVTSDECAAEETAKDDCLL